MDLAVELQSSTGISCLWGTANLFSTRRYMNGASTNPDAHVFAYAAAQVKKVMEVTHRLGGQNLVFWGGREGYQSLLNTDVRQELDHMAAFFRMVVAYKAKIGATYQLLLGEGGSSLWGPERGHKCAALMVRARVRQYPPPSYGLSSPLPLPCSSHFPCPRQSPNPRNQPLTSTITTRRL